MTAKPGRRKRMKPNDESGGEGGVPEGPVQVKRNASACQKAWAWALPGRLIRPRIGEA